MCAHYLVTYATRFGSTAEVAEAIGMVLEQTGAFADVRPVSDVTRLDRYDGVVVGSAIRGGKWLPEAFQFLEAHRSVLATMPVAYFTLCLTLRSDTPDNRRTVFSYHAPLVREFPEVRPVSIGMFAGAIDFDDLPAATRRMARNSSILEGDFRDWSLIRDWALSIRPLLVGSPNARPFAVS
ncbi:MAG: flavodoxin domain-containing protein [Anaerolineae bacterium]|nr:flavodoxin domain-containing protein [Anaerolineae bacterium]